MLFPWMLVLTGVALFLFVPTAHAQLACKTTVWSGLVVNETWTAAGSPYCVTSDLAVKGLIIEKGIEVRVDGPYMIVIHTTIDASGTEDQPILEHLVIRNNTAPRDGAGLRVHLDTGGLTITDCDIIDNSSIRDGGGVHAKMFAGTLTIEGCKSMNRCLPGAISRLEPR